MSCVDESPGSVPADLSYTAEESEALQLAQELKDRVGRERAVVRRLRAHLSRTRSDAEQ